jgi:hypothetical protein
MIARCDAQGKAISVERLQFQSSPRIRHASARVFTCHVKRQQPGFHQHPCVCDIGRGAGGFDAIQQVESSDSLASSIATSTSGAEFGMESVMSDEHAEAEDAGVRKLLIAWPCVSIAVVAFTAHNVHGCLLILGSCWCRLCRSLFVVSAIACEALLCHLLICRFALVTMLGFKHLGIIPNVGRRQLPNVLAFIEFGSGSKMLQTKCRWRFYRVHVCFAW